MEVSWHITATESATRPAPTAPTRSLSCVLHLPKASRTPVCSRRCALCARASFVPGEMRNEVGHDSAIPIGQAQTTSQPSLIGLMIEALEARAWRAQS